MEGKRVGLEQSIGIVKSQTKPNKPVDKPNKASDGDNNFKKTLEAKKKQMPNSKKTDKKSVKPDKKSVKPEELQNNENDDTAKKLSDAAAELLSMLEEVMALLDNTDTPIASDIAVNIEEMIDDLKSMIENMTLNDVKAIESKTIELTSLMNELVNVEVSQANVAEIQEGVLKLSEFSKKLESAVKEVSSISTNTLSDDKDIMLTDVGASTEQNSNSEENEDDSRSDRATSATKQQATKVNAVKLINKNGFIEAYGSKEDLDNSPEILEDVTGSSVKIQSTVNNAKVRDTNFVNMKNNEIINQVTQEISVNITEEASEMMLKLRPDHLGKLSMRVVIERGIMVANFEVESQVVKEAIEAGLDDLKSSLEDKGFNIKEFNVEVNKDNSEGNSHHESNFFSSNTRRKNLTKVLNEDVSPVAAESNYGQSIQYGLQSKVNILA